MAPWIKIRTELYRQLERRVQYLVGREDKDLSIYRRHYDKEFEKTWQGVNREILFREVNRADIILLGDFHALQQAQKTQLRVLRESDNKRPKLLAVEFFEAKDQASVERFLTGDYDEKTFLKKIEWEKRWGFPWENYRPLIRYAQKHKIPVFGLNKIHASRDLSSLRDRDKFAAKGVQRLRESFPEHRIFVVFGDLHLAQSHLPRAIAKVATKRLGSRLLTLFQNSETIYLQLLEKELELAVDVVRLSEDQFCILSVPPWVKWQNFLLYLERHLDRGFHREGVEYTDYVARYLQLLSDDFSVQAPKPDYAIYTPEDSEAWDKIRSHYEGRRLRVIQDLVEESRSFYLPEFKEGYLARPSVNHAAQLAMSILHSHLSGWSVTPIPGSEEFLRMIWLEAVQYFGSKMINPRRKTDTLSDIRAALASRNQADRGQEAMQLALHQKMREFLLLNGQRSEWSKFRPRLRSSYREASRLLGGLLGEKLYTGFRKKIIRMETVVALLKKPVDRPGFESFYFEVIELVEGLPDPFLSKTERL